MELGYGFVTGGSLNLCGSGYKSSCEIWGLHGDEDSCQRLRGCDTV